MGVDIGPHFNHGLPRLHQLSEKIDLAQRKFPITIQRPADILVIAVVQHQPVPVPAPDPAIVTGSGQAVVCRCLEANSGRPALQCPGHLGQHPVPSAGLLLAEQPQ